MFQKAVFPRAEAPVETERPAPAPTMALTVDELARELHLGRSTAYNLANSPGFPSFRVGKKLLISREGLQRWMAEQCHPPAGS